MLCLRSEEALRLRLDGPEEEGRKEEKLSIKSHISESSLHEVSD